MRGSYRDIRFARGRPARPNNFAEQIFPLRIGMRVIVVHDDVAPMRSLIRFCRRSYRACPIGMALRMAYQAEDITRSSRRSPIRRWPSREAQFEALKAIAAESAAEADAATARADASERAAAANFSKLGKAAKASCVAALASVPPEQAAKAERGPNRQIPHRPSKFGRRPDRTTSSAITDAQAKIVSLTIKLMIAHEEFERAREEAAPAEAAKGGCRERSKGSGA